MSIRNILWGIIGLGIGFYGCTDEKQPEELSGGVVVEFTSVVEGNPETRASANRWESGDAIGVFMKRSGQELSAGNIVGGVDNMKFVTSGNGNFTAASPDAVTYPADGSRVDFIAYYPWQNQQDGYVCHVNVAGQKATAGVDLLYANNATGLNQDNASASLAFSHQLSRLVLNISAGEGISSLNGLEVTLAGMKTQADFSLSDGQLTIDAGSVADIKVPLVADGNGMKGEVIVLPATDLTGVKLNITLGGTLQSCALQAVSGFEKGRTYIYSLKLKNSNASVDPDPDIPGYRTWLETPRLTKETMKDCMYVVHYMPNNRNARNYSMLYDTIQKLAYWVAYPLCSSHTGESGRSDAWGYDPEIKPELQPNMKKGLGGYDRGHQIPSGDRTCDRTTNATTFYYSNMTAQVGAGMNQTIWAQLENQVRNWRSGVDTLYVVTGAMITTPADQKITYVKDNSGKNFAKPKYYFKVLARRIRGTYRTIGFRLENRVYSGNNFNACRVTVADLEKETGFTFFPNVPQEAKNTIDASW